MVVGALVFLLCGYDLVAAEAPYGFIKFSAVDVMNPEIKVARGASQMIIRILRDGGKKNIAKIKFLCQDASSAGVTCNERLLIWEDEVL